MKQVFIRSSHYYYCEKTICMRCTVTQLARESVVLCPLLLFVCERNIRVITQQSGKQNHKNDSCTQFAHEDVGLWPSYNSYVKKNANCLLQNYLKRF